VFFVVSVCFVIDSVRKLLDTPSFVDVNIEGSKNVNTNFVPRMRRVFCSSLSRIYGRAQCWGSVC